MFTRYALLFPLLVASSGVGCGPAVPPVPPPAEPALSPSSAALPAASIAAAPVPPPRQPEPGDVRCGKSAISLNPPPDLSGTDRRFLGYRPSLHRSPPAGPTVSLKAGALRLGTTPLPGASGMVNEASGEPCASLAAVSDRGPLELEIEMNESAVPAFVHPSRPQPSPYVRCLMGHACLVKAGPWSASQRLALSLAIRVDPPGVVVPSDIAVQLAPGQESSPSREQLTRLVTDLGQKCMLLAGPVEGRAQLLVELQDRPSGSQTGIFFEISGLLLEGAVSGLLYPLRDCLEKNLMKQIVKQDKTPRSQALVRFNLEISRP